MRRIDIDDVELGYLYCALWASTDDEGESFDGRGLEAYAPETRAKMRADVEAFVKTNMLLLLASGMKDEHIGHDFWLTRNGHGAGFWDRGMGYIGEQLTKACKAYPEVKLCVGDDGKIYL